MRILQSTGYMVEGFVISIDNYSIQHTLKRHGDELLKAAHGQKAVMVDDFKLIVNIVLHGCYKGCWKS